MPWLKSLTQAPKRRNNFARGTAAELLFFIAILFFLSCNKASDTTPATIPNNPVFVVCEGSLGNGNGALTLYNPDSNKTTEDVYKSINGGSLGDIFQSITRIGDNFFLCINNSDKVLVVNGKSLLLQKTITIPKPRYILPINETKAYVSTIFSNRIFVINPQSAIVTDTLIMPFKNPEAMLMIGNTAYICTWDTATKNIYPVNTATGAIGSGISVAGKAPQEITTDAEGMLWVLSGNKASGVESKLTRINPANGSIIASYAFGTADPVRLITNRAKDSLYFIEVSYTGGASSNGVYRMGIHDANLPTSAFIAAKGLQYFWGIAIHPATGYLYIADPVGFTQRGKVYIYKADGNLVNTFPTGVGPGHFYME